MKSVPKISLCFSLLIFCIKAGASLESLAEASFNTEQQEVIEAATKNDLADDILARPSLHHAFASEFLALLDDPSQGTIWHNYILQKLDTLYLHSDAAEQREAILKRLWKESRSPTPTFAGTTLMTLQRLHEQRPYIVEAAKLAKHAQWVAEREAYSNSDRLSALHVLSAIAPEPARIVARTWLELEDSPLLLKTTAIAVLGKQPTESDRSLIQPFLKHPDLRLRTAARSRLERDVPNE